MALIPKFNGELWVPCTSLTIPVILRSTTDNREVTGVAHGDVTAYYWRELYAPVAITPASLASATEAFTAGGWFEMSATHMPGVYRFDIPPAATDDSTGTNFVTISVQVAGCYSFVKTITFDSVARYQVYYLLTHPTAGLSNLVRAANPANLLQVDASGVVEANMTEWQGLPPVALNADYEPVVSVNRFSASGIGYVTDNVEALLDETNRGEPAAGAPPDNPTITEMLEYLYLAMKNKLSSTNNTLKLHNKDGTELTQSTLSDDGTTFTRSKFVAP